MSAGQIVAGGAVIYKLALTAAVPGWGRLLRKLVNNCETDISFGAGTSLTQIDSRRPFVAGLAMLDYGCAVLIDRNDLPKHLFCVPDLDLSDDLCVEPLAGPWFRLGACSRVPEGTNKVWSM
jgi:hypothetical protein